MIPLRTNITHGYCQCGCGEKTNIAPVTSRGIGWIKGEPIRFIIGHANRQPRLEFSDADSFKIDGVYCKLLSLTRGLFSIIDADDYDLATSLYWAATKTKYGFYVCRKAPTKKKVTGRHVYLHRFLLGLDPDDPREGDHINGIGLDNRRKNIRSATTQQNKQNCKMHITNTSGRKGVSWCKERSSWFVQIKVNGNTKNLGRYAEFERACAVREAAEKQYHGEFARPVSMAQ